MKKYLIIAFATVVSVAVNAQTEKKEVKKDIKIEETNGVKTMTITTISDGQTTKEIYTGADVHRKLSEMDKNVTLSEPTVENRTENVEVTIEDGVKTVKIQKNVNGVVTEEVYTGAEADKKLEEIKMDPSTETQEKIRTTIHKETHNE